MEILSSGNFLKKKILIKHPTSIPPNSKQNLVAKFILPSNKIAATTYKLDANDID